MTTTGTMREAWPQAEAGPELPWADLLLSVLRLIGVYGTGPLDKCL